MNSEKNVTEKHSVGTVVKRDSWMDLDDHLFIKIVSIILVLNCLLFNLRYFNSCNNRQ